MMDPPYNGPKMEARRSSGSTFVEAPCDFEVDDLDEEARVYGTRWAKVQELLAKIERLESSSD